MKTSIWDLLTGIVLLGILCLIGAFGIILANPNTPLNPLRPGGQAGPGGGQIVTPILLPSATMTVPGLPPTWTPRPTAEDTKSPVDANGLRPSSTPMPTNTILVLPTFTPSKTAYNGIGGGTCVIVKQDPLDGSFIAKGSNFTASWTIKNSSKDVWASDSVDIRYISGDRMHTGNDVIDMPYDVGVGGMLEYSIKMTAPSTGGSYVTNWALVKGSITLCRFYVVVNVN